MRRSEAYSTGTTAISLFRSCGRGSRTPRLLRRQRTSIAWAVDRRSLAPHAAAKRLRFGLSFFQLRKARQRDAGGDARQSFTEKNGVHEHAVFGRHIRQMAVVRVGRRPILL